MPADSDIAHEFDPINVGTGENVCNKCGQNGLHPSHHGWSKHELLKERAKELAKRYADDSQSTNYKIIDPLVTVKIGPEDDRIDAIVESVGIKPNGAIWYHVAWWNGRDRKEAEVPASEVGIASPSDLRTVGFITK